METKMNQMLRIYKNLRFHIILTFISFQLTSLSVILEGLLYIKAPADGMTVKGKPRVWTFQKEMVIIWDLQRN